MKILVEFVDLIAVEISIIVFILFNFYVQVAWTVVWAKPCWFTVLWSRKFDLSWFLIILSPFFFGSPNFWSASRIWTVCELVLKISQLKFYTLLYVVQIESCLEFSSLNLENVGWMALWEKTFFQEWDFNKR